MTPNNLKLNPNPPQEWRVKWEIDILTDTAEDAAREARDIQRDPRSIASVFHVIGEGMDKFVEIDLGEIDPIPEITTHHAPAPSRPESSRLTGTEWDIVGALRGAGWAVVIFNPDELRGANPERVQDRLVELGWEVIDTLSDEPADPDDPEALSMAPPPPEAPSMPPPYIARIQIPMPR